MCIHLENNNEHNSMWHSFIEIQCSTILHCILLYCISVTIGLRFILYIYIYTSNSYKLKACHLHLPIPAIVSTPSVQVKTTLPWGWFCCQAPSQILAAAKCQMALRCGLFCWRNDIPPPHPCFHSNLFVIPREFSVQNTVQTVAWKAREKMLKDIELIASKSRENVEENF